MCGLLDFEEEEVVIAVGLVLGGMEGDGWGMEGDGWVMDG